MDTNLFNFELSEAQIKDKERLVEALRNNKTIQRFMEHYDCPFEVVEENLYRFKDWLEALDRVNKLSQEALDVNPYLGEYINLTYDSVAKVLLDEHKMIASAQKAYQAKQYLGAYELFPLNKSLQKASFETGVFGMSYKESLEALTQFFSNDILGYYIYGDLGVGKSYLAACVTNRAAKQGKSVAFVSVAELLSELKRNFNKSYEVDYTLERLKVVDVLVIDDLGAEPISTWGRDEVLLPLLNHRLENYRKTLFTSNYPMDMLETLYAIDQKGNVDKLRSKRFVDRIYAIAQPLEIIGKNRRHNR